MFPERLPWWMPSGAEAGGGVTPTIRSYNPAMDAELQNALLSFMGYFELVLDNDWEFTKTIPEYPEYYIAKDGTFFHPGWKTKKQLGQSCPSSGVLPQSKSHAEAT